MGDPVAMPPNGLPTASKKSPIRSATAPFWTKREAIETALDEAPEGGLVVILPESVTRSINLINARNPLPDPQITETVHAAEAKAEAGTAEESTNSASDQYAEAHL